MKAVYTLLIIAALGACSKNPNEMAAKRGVPDSIDGQISEAVRVSDGMSRQVAAVNIATVKPMTNEVVQGGDGVPSGTSSGGTDATPPGVILPPDAVQPVTVTWNGELEAFLANMAGRGGYVFKVIGTRPATPLNIAIVADEEPFFGVIRRAGNLAMGEADVAFNPSQKTIEIRYRG